MKEIFEKQLFNDFPLLYDKPADVKPSRIGFGFECGDGWYQLIFDLSKKLYPFVEEWRRKLPGEFDFYPRVTQVKEKFGELRFYVEGCTDEMYELIKEYEEISSKVCDVCGKPGEINYTKKWLAARCEEHR